MTYYIEYVFIENLIINYIIIYQISRFTKTKTKNKNKILGILILSFYTTLNFFLFKYNIINVLIKIFVASFCVYIIYIPKTIKIYFKLYVYYFLISFLLVGLTISLTLFLNLDISNFLVKIILYIVSGSLLYLLYQFMWKMWKSNIKKDDLIYILKIKDIEINCFVDTGNNVHDYINNLDVVFIENNYFNIFLKNNLLNNKLNLDINTITGKQEYNGYILNNVKVIKNKEEICEFKKVIFVFVYKSFSENSNNEYNALISYNTYIDRLKGVELC